MKNLISFHHISLKDLLYLHGKNVQKLYKNREIYRKRGEEGEDREQAKKTRKYARSHFQTSQNLTFISLKER
jgi:hypothetical protein